jgi:SAM-dependent methyltransferase
MDAEAWNQRYAAAERVWSVEPNVWVVQVVDGLPADRPPGRALDLACGEGRNAVWLADRGWRVTAVDFSAVALARGRVGSVGSGGSGGADAAGAVEWIEADVVSWAPAPGTAFDLVIVAYLHLPSADRRTVLTRAASWLASGGTIAVIGHDRRNIAEGVGGPQVPEILLDPGEVAGDLRGPGGLHVDRADTVERPTADGVALDTLVVASRR